MPAGLAKLALGPSWQTPPHIELLNRVLIDVAFGRIKRLIITMPPRHGKSEMTSRFFPAWYLGTFPTRRVMIASYEGNFAASWSRKARDVLREYGPSVFGIGLSRAAGAAGAWETSAPDGRGYGGGMMAAGVKGAFTGKGANLLIIDDPVKNADEAFSPTYRERAWDFYHSTARPRLEPNASIVVIQTRWHADDLAGRLIRDSANGTGDKFLHLNLPALAEADDLLGRAEGEALWPDRWPVEALDDIRHGGEGMAYWWAALYQQRPAPLEGALFKRDTFRYFDVAADGTEAVYSIEYDDGTRRLWRASECLRFGVADLAVTTGKTSDYTAVGHFALTPHNELLLLEMVRLRTEGPDIKGLLVSLWLKWQCAFMGIEGVASQMHYVQEARREGLPVKKLDPGRENKETRAIPVAMRMRDGKVRFRRGATWLADLEAELLVFNHGTHDDQVDVLSYAGEQRNEARARVRVVG